MLLEGAFGSLAISFLPCPDSGLPSLFAIVQTPHTSLSAVTFHSKDTNRGFSRFSTSKQQLLVQSYLKNDTDASQALCYYQGLPAQDVTQPEPA